MNSNESSGNKRWFLVASLLFLMVLTLASACLGQERPYFVTYSTDMEEPGNLEIATKSAIGKPPDGNRFWGMSMEFEYGAKAWWTTEFYLDGVTVAQDSTIFTGFRWENRFRPLAREHWINPVLYVEFENINGADKSLLEVVGHDGVPDFAGRDADSRQEKKRELELKLILSSNFKGWNVSENLIFEKNLNNNPWDRWSRDVRRPGRSLHARIARHVAIRGAGHQLERAGWLDFELLAAGRPERFQRASHLSLRRFL
jgi:hypothetical protein